MGNEGEIMNKRYGELENKVTQLNAEIDRMNNVVKLKNKEIDDLKN